MRSLPPIVENADMPEDSIALVQDGKVVGSIVNIGKPKAIEGEVVNPVNYRDITDVTDKLIHVSEVANWHEFCEDDANKLIANDKMMTVSSSAVGHSDWLRERFINGPIQPTSIDKATAAYKFGWDHANANPTVERLSFEQFYRDPSTCTHYRKRMSTATLKFRCLDCGEECL